MIEWHLLYFHDRSSDSGQYCLLSSTWYFYPFCLFVSICAPSGLQPSSGDSAFRPFFLFIFSLCQFRLWNSLENLFEAHLEPNLRPMKNKSNQWRCTELFPAFSCIVHGKIQTHLLLKDLHENWNKLYMIHGSSTVTSFLKWTLYHFRNGNKCGMRSEIFLSVKIWVTLDFYSVRVRGNDAKPYMIDNA